MGSRSDAGGAGPGSGPGVGGPGSGPGPGCWGLNVSFCDPPGLSVTGNVDGPLSTGAVVPRGSLGGFL